jgi:hypothetical protein
VSTESGKLVSETVSKFTNLKGRKKYEYLHERVKVLFLCDETCTLKEIQIQERNRLETELNSRVHELYVKIALKRLGKPKSFFHSFF